MACALVHRRGGIGPIGLWVSVSGRGAGADEDGGEEEKAADGHEEDAEAGIAGVGEEATDKKSGGHQDGRSAQEGRSEAARFWGPVRREGGHESEAEVEHAEQGSVSVGKGPHESAHFGMDAEVGLNFETVQAFEDEAHGEEQEDGPPTEDEMTAGEQFGF